MAVTQCAYLNFSLLNNNKHTIHLSLSSASISSFKVKPTTRRTNHLRNKLLKTLTKPNPNPLLPQPPTTIPIVPILPHETLEHNEVTISQEKADTGDFSNVFIVGFGKHWFFKLGLLLVGIFVFQTVCAVLVFGSDDIVREEEKDLVFEEKSNIFPLNENGYMGVSDMEERVSEIQAMAREARESEKLRSEAEEEDNGGGVVRTGIEKEVDNRLVRLQKLRGSVKKMPPVTVREQDDIDGKDKIEPLMIKKKYKYRGPLGSLSYKPKGFSGTKERNGFDSLDLLSSGSSASVTPALGLDTERKQPKEWSKEFQTSGKKPGNERMQKKHGNYSGKAEPASKMGESNGATQETSLERPVRSNKSTSKDVDDGQLNGQWWLSLPYVVAVLMGRGLDGEGPRGLFTLKTDPYTNDNLSYIVAFEDRVDATNLCYIIESFFEDLGDFSANIVPLSVKELEVEVKSHSKKVVVVRKGQLKLYAGQPLAEVEMALRSLVQ